MSPHAFNLLILVAESFKQINQFNSVVVERPQILTKVNECCCVVPSECTTKRILYNRVMRGTNVSLNADVLHAVEERRVRWTTYANLLAWFENFRTFFIEFDLAQVGSNGELDIEEEQLCWILNVDKTKNSINRSKTRAGGRPAVSFHDPHLSVWCKPRWLTL